MASLWCPSASTPLLPGNVMHVKHLSGSSAQNPDLVEVPHQPWPQSSLQHHNTKHSTFLEFQIYFKACCFISHNCISEMNSPFTSIFFFNLPIYTCKYLIVLSNWGMSFAQSYSVHISVGTRLPANAMVWQNDLIRISNRNRTGILSTQTWKYSIKNESI